MDDSYDDDTFMDYEFDGSDDGCVVNSRSFDPLIRSFFVDDEPVSKPTANYTVLTPADIAKKQDELIDNVAEVFAVHLSLLQCQAPPF